MYSYNSNKKLERRIQLKKQYNKNSKTKTSGDHLRENKITIQKIVRNHYKR